MKPPPRTLRLDIDELEMAFECLPGDEWMMDAEPSLSFLDLTSGSVIELTEEEAGECFRDEDKLPLPGKLFDDLHAGSLDDFVNSLPDDPLRRKLEQTIRGKGAWRRFEAIVFGGGMVELKHRWHWFETRRKRERIVEWLEQHHIAPDWGYDIFEPPALPDKRAELLAAVRDFVSSPPRSQECGASPCSDHSPPPRRFQRTLIYSSR